jgi:5-methyltetrahydrofolate--homocysteine methyltransferase
MNMNLLERLKHEVLLLDGAMGTILGHKLQKRGIELKNYVLANYLYSTIIDKIHRAYISAGADIITTNTLTGTRKKLEQASDEKVDAAAVSILNEEAVEIAMNTAKGKSVYVAGSIGSLGEFIMREGYEIGMPKAEALSLYQEQAEALSDADFFLIETMFDLEEAKVAAEAVQGYDKPVAVSFSLEKGKTLYGDSLEKIAEECEQAGVDILGINCVEGMEPAINYVKELKKYSHLPLIVYPNAGKPDTKGNYPETPKEMAKRLPELLELGVSIVGGCCGTTPSHIREFRKVIDRHKRELQSN